MRIAIDRRVFLGQSAASLIAAGATGPAVAAEPSSRRASEGNRPKKSVMFSMLPSDVSIEDRFKLAREVGFEGVESSPVATEDEANRMRAAAEAAGIPIHSVIHGGWDNPLSSPDPAVVSRGLDAARHAMQSAKWMGAEDILLVPAVVNAGVRYIDAYKRSQKNIRELIPTAEKLGVMILIEEVWNKFLLSPLEFARYIDEFRHPLVQAYFDVGNVLIWAYPEDWIRTLGRRVRRVHLKDFKRSTYQFVNLLDGDVNWPEVRRALGEVGFTSFMNTELPGGNRAYLRDVSLRVDKILAGV